LTKIFFKCSEKNKSPAKMICTPKVRRFWRCISKQGQNLFVVGFLVLTLTDAGIVLVKKLLAVWVNAVGNLCGRV